MAYKREVHVKTRDEIRRRKEIAESDYNLRHAEVCAKLPEITVLEKEMREASLGAIRLIGNSVTDCEKYVEELRVKSLDSQAKRKKILTDNGYPEDYLEVHYYCPLCRDTGYAGEKICTCVGETMKRIAAEDFMKSSPLKLASFDTFNSAYYPSNTDPSTGVIPRERMQKVLTFAKTYADTFTKKSGNLIFSGKTGLGKTHLALAIARTIVEKGYNVIYDTVPDIMTRLEREHFGRFGNSADTMETLENCDFLILDDLGAEFITQFTVAQLYSLINNRIQRGNPTIISTNLIAHEMEEKYSERITSRLLGEYSNIQFIGKDIRQLLNK